MLLLGPFATYLGCGVRQDPIPYVNYKLMQEEQEQRKLKEKKVQALTPPTPTQNKIRGKGEKPSLSPLENAGKDSSLSPMPPEAPARKPYNNGVQE